MSDQKPTRTMNEIKEEYTNACLKAGNLQYELLCKTDDLRVLNEHLKSLNFEYIAAKNAEDAKVASEPKKEE